MFTNESTENLLETLEYELTEVIEFDNPQTFSIEDENSQDNRAPIPMRRNNVPDLPRPVPTARQSLDKNEKNDENEIIQLSSMSSSASETHKNISQNTIVVARERKAKPTSNKILAVHEADKLPTDETFFVIKHGKWAHDERAETSFVDKEDSVVVEIEQPPLMPRQSHVEVISEKPKRQISKQISSSSATSGTQTSLESSSESSSSSEESAKANKKAKKRLKNKEKKKLEKKFKKKVSSEEQTSSTGNAIENAVSSQADFIHAIGFFLHSTSALKFKINLQTPRVKISFYNEDSGKQVGDAKWSKPGTFNNEFYNLICAWNEMLVIDQDFSRLKEIYNNILVFFEVINAEGVVIFWAFLKLFSPQFANIDDKFQLQFFEYQKTNRNFLSRFTSRNPTELNIYEQWRVAERKKYLGTLSVTVKILNQKQEKEKENLEEVKQLRLSTDSITRKWQKLPGQACKIPNKLFNKLQFHEKGSMNVKFSQDGTLLALTEITKDGSVLHIQKFPEMVEVFTMLEHSELIHDIDWLRQKQTLDGHQWMVTGSSDFTAIVWRIEQSCYTYNILPHPSFVYASKFLQHEDSSRIQVVTAGRDCIVRIWQTRKKMEGFELAQEMKHPNSNKSSYITAIATRNADTFYTSNSNGDIIEFTLQVNKEYHLNRHFKLDEITGKIITSLELHPRGNKIFFRVQDFSNSDVTGTIFVLGVPTGFITQRHQQPPVKSESQGRLKVTSCGTHLFASNGSTVRYYSLSNGNVTSSVKNFLNIKIPAGEKISSMDYHPKDFYFACSVYGRNGSVIVCNYEADSDEKDLFDKLKVESGDIARKSQIFKATANSHFTDIIRKLDEVFLAPIDSDLSRRLETTSRNDDNTFSVESKRSRTYTVSQGPATYTIQKNQNTYEIQRKDDSDDDTTISESLN